MQNKSVTKILLGIFIIGISFLGYNVFAVSSANNPGECSNVTNYSPLGYSQATNPKGNVKSGASTLTEDFTWYFNDRQALEWWYEFHSGSVNDSGSMSAIIDFRLSIFKKFDNEADFQGSDKVWHLQNALKQAGCQTTPDCKLGKITSEKFFTCNGICDHLGSGLVDSLSKASIVCATGYEVATEGLGKDVCCKKIELLPPDILVNETDCSCDDNKDDCEFNVEDGPLNVEVDYLANEKIDLQVGNTGLISIDGGTMSGMTVDLTRKIIKFQITPSKNTVKIIVGTGVMKASGTNEDIPGNEAQFTISGCNNLPVNGECSQGFVLCNGCCSECSTPSTGGDCSGYGSGYVSYLGGACCKFDCSVGSGCNPGKKWDKTKCKCICDPSQTCCGIQLNTVVPFIGDCIEMVDSDTALGLNVDTASSRVTQITAFPYLMMGLTKIVVTAILILSIIIVIASGVLMVTGGIGGDGYSKGTKLLKNVIISLILLGCSGLILKLINPTFFGG